MYLPYLAIILCQIFLRGGAAHAAVVATGFQDTVVTTVTSPSVLAFAPDGRLFIGEKASGRIRIYKSGGLLAQPFLDVNAFVPSGTYFDTFNERGLLGIAVDPSFNSNGFVYVYFTVCKAPANPPQPGTNTCQLAKNRVVRFTANGDVVTAGSQVVLLDDIDNDAGNHNSGWLGFGPLDGKLYVAVGDGGSNSAKAQDLGSLNGKILRIGANGAVPSNNPFVGQAGARGEVWARGLRNPFRCRFAPDGRLFCADVGANGWEEIDVIAKAANYGWPSTEGAFNAASFPQFTNPIYSYARGSVSSAIIGGEFGSKTGFPGNYQQSFFFGDFARGVIQRALLNGAGTAVQSVDDLVTGIGGNSLTDLLAGPDGALYYTVYGANQVRRVTATSSNRSPVAKSSADVLSGVPPLTVQFSSAGSSDPDGDAITYSWNFGDGTATSAVANPTHPYTASGTYVATLTVSDGKASPGPGTATVTITVGRAPEITITSPTDGASFRAGDLIAVAGSAVDPDDGPLPSASLHWKVIFHHADHTHPYIDDLPGSPQSFATNTGGEPDPDVGYEIQLSATDSTGLTGTDSVFILPVTSVVTLATSPAGLGLTLDGQPVTSPKTFTGVVGLARSIGAPSTQSVGGQSYYFGGWSDGGLPTHTILTPELDGTFTATFLPGATCNAPAVIPAQGGTFTGVTGGTSNQAGTCNITNNAPEQVFQWTPTVSGSATIDTCGGATSFDTVLYVRGGPCATGSQLACVDDIAGCTTSEPNDHHASRTALAVTAGQTYFIVVDGYNGASGTFSLTITPPTASAPTSTRTATPSRTVTLTPALTPTPTPTPTATALPTTSATIAGAPTPTRTVTPTFMGAPTPSATPVGGNLTQLGTIVAAVPNPIGGGSKNLQIIRDGNKPPVGSGNSGLQFDTFDGANTASEDWIGYVYPTTYTFQRVVFQEGMHFSNGGWFDTLTVQVRQGGAWTNVTGFVSTPTYPAINNGVSYETYTLTFNDAVGDGIRIDGAPGGSNDFFSVGELEAYGGSADPMATPTRTMTPTLSPTSAATRTSTPAPTVTNVTTATATPVVNDCSNPTLVPANGGTFTGITNGSNTQAGSCALTNKVGERVFQWTPTISGRALVSTCGSGTLYDTVVYIRTGTCGGGAELGCNDDTAGCGTGEPNDHHGSRLSPLVVAGQTYFIVVDGYDTSAGQFTLTIGVPVATTATPIATVTPIVTSTPLPPTPVPPATASTVVPTALPSPCGATILPAQGGTFTGVTSGSNVEAGSCGLTNMGPETIYQWTPTASGTATIATCGTGTLYDTVLYMRNGSCRGGELACNDDVAGCGTGEPNDHHGSRLTPTVTAGQTYFIVVDGYNGGQGAFSLTITPPPTAVATPSS